MAELSTICATAKTFILLRAEVESEWLPRLLELGSHLRRLLRTGQLSAAEVEQAAAQVVDLRRQWFAALGQVRASPVYRSTLAAWAANDQGALAGLIPQTFSYLQVVQPTPALFLPVSPSSGRRRPGSSPFLGARECAQQITQLLSAGVEPESGGSEWWESELAYIEAADDCTALDSPISLRLASETDVAAFRVLEEATFRIFTPRLHARMSVVLAAEAGDEWWQAYENSYQTFRQQLRSEIEQSGIAVEEPSG